MSIDRSSYEPIGNEEQHHDFNNTNNNNNVLTDSTRISFHEVYNPKLINNEKIVIPRDWYYIGKIMFLILGSGTLIPGLCFQLSIDWFQAISPSSWQENTNVIQFLEYILNFGFNLGQIVAIIVYTIIMWKNSVHSLRKVAFSLERSIYIAFLLNFVCVTVALFLNVIIVTQYGLFTSNDNYDIKVILILIILLNSITGLGSGVLCSGLLSFASNFPWKYTVFYLVGLSCGNALLSVLRVMSKGIWYDTRQGMFNSIVLFFTLSAAFEIISIISFIILLRLPITKYCRQHYVNMRTPRRFYGDVRAALEKQKKQEQQAEIISLKTQDSESEENFHNFHENIVNSAVDLNAQAEEEIIEENDEDTVSLSEKEEEEEEVEEPQFVSWYSLLRKIWSPGLGVFVTFLLTFSLAPGLITDIVIVDGKSSWNPVITLTVFNVADCIGRALPSSKRTILLSHKQLWILIALRLGFIPAIIFCINPVLIDSIWVVIILLIFGLTHGYCCSIGMTTGPCIVKYYEQEKAAYLMNVFLNTGLVIGSAIGVGMGYLVHYGWSPSD
ncbi:hypothetical protein ABK040_008428 [Willaertia magna]